MSILFLITTPQPTSTLFPYTTLFRSQQFRQVGIALQYFEVVTANTPMDTALYPGLWFTSQVADSNPVLTRFQTRQIAGPENRFVGMNRNGYSSPASDRLIDAIDTSFAAEDRARNWAEW